MNYISDILYWISTGLLVPVIVLLILLFIRGFSALGSQAVGLNLADPELSARIYRAREMSDVDARIALNRELEKEIAFEKALYLPIVSGKGEWVLSPRLKNFHLSWQGWAAGATRDLELDPAYGK